MPANFNIIISVYLLNNIYSRLVTNDQISTCMNIYICYPNIESSNITFPGIQNEK